MRDASAPRRTDIDGLRAVAVLPVVAYHVGVHAVPGGFIGVDVFFVISGYLITQVLLNDIRGERFSIVKFYERRVRRILPALIAVLVVTFCVCARYGLPAEFVDFSKSLIATALSISNVYFWQTSGYFTAPALTKPLLHTWSLAVEEQFYLFWPLFLWVGIRLFRNHLLAVTAVIIAVSFAISAVGAVFEPTATFYLVHTRTWELLLGATVALGAFTRTLGPLSRNLLCTTGLILIAVSALTIQSDMPFPGILALPACLGALLVIIAGRDGDSIPGRVLSWKPIVFVGLISYSLYLWHWPLIVFQRNYALLLTGGTERTQKIVIIAWSLAAGAISWWFIEQPYRVGRFRPPRRRLFQQALAATVAVIALGALAVAQRGFPARYTPQQLRIASYLKYDAGPMFRNGRCFLADSSREFFDPTCLAIDSLKKNYLLLGDSHAAELWAGLRAAYPQLNFLQATAADCLPLITHSLGELPYCTRIMDRVIRDFIPSHKIDMVIIAARWKADHVDRIAATLDWFRERNIRVTLIGPTVVYDSPFPRLLLTAERANNPALPDAHWDHSLILLDQQLAKIAAMHGAGYVSLIRMLCAGFRCSLEDSKGLPLFHDREHLTLEGSQLLAQRLRAHCFLVDPHSRGLRSAVRIGER